jgi:putative hemin transport protein
MKAALIREKRTALAEENSKINPREQAERIGVSEGAMVASSCGEGTVRLKRERSAQLCQWVEFGEVLSVSRNRAALLEVQGRYPKCQFFEGLGWMQGAPLDLRLNLSQWAEGFYVPADETRGASFQYFNGDGIAVHKLFFPPGRAPDAAWINSQQHRNQKPDFEWTRSPGTGYSGDEAAELDHEQFMKKWETLGELHNFNRLLKQFCLSRLQAIRMAGEDHAQRLNREAAARVLEEAARAEICIELELDNGGLSQRYRGVLPRLESYGKWINLLSDRFNLHLDESQINQVWRVAVPTKHGVVHVLEIFDKSDRPALRLIPADGLQGKEPSAWKEIMQACEKLSIDDV